MQADEKFDRLSEMTDVVDIVFKTLRHCSTKDQISELIQHVKGSLPVNLCFNRAVSEQESKLEKGESVSSMNMSPLEFFKHMKKKRDDGGFDDGDEEMDDAT